MVRRSLDLRRHSVYDVVTEYAFSRAVAKKVARYGLSLSVKAAAKQLADQGIATVAMESAEWAIGRLCRWRGQDGAELAEAFVEAVSGTKIGAVLLTGPFMPLARGGTIAAQRGVAHKPSRLHLFTRGGHFARGGPSCRDGRLQHGLRRFVVQQTALYCAARLAATRATRAQRASMSLVSLTCFTRNIFRQTP